MYIPLSCNIQKLYQIKPRENLLIALKNPSYYIACDCCKTEYLKYILEIVQHMMIDVLFIVYTVKVIQILILVIGMLYLKNIIQNQILKYQKMNVN